MSVSINASEWNMSLGELIIQGLIEIYNDWVTPLTARAARMVKRVKVHGSGLSYAEQRVLKLLLGNACTDWNQVGHLAETFSPFLDSQG